MVKSKKIYKKLIVVLSFTVATLLISMLYSEKCSTGGGLMNFCIFEGRGLPLPYYSLDKIDWSILLFDFVFWFLIFFIILFKKLFVIIKK